MNHRDRAAAPVVPLNTPTNETASVGPMSPLHTTTVVVYIIIAVFIFVKNLLIQDWFYMFLGPVSLLGLLIVPLAERLLRIKLGAPMHAFVLFFVSFSFQLGVVERLYNRVSWFDLAAHFLSGILFTLTGFCLYGKLNPYHKHRDSLPVLQGCFALFFSMFIAAMWEIAEFLTFLAVGHDAQHHLTTGVFDTMEDMLACLIGSAIALIDFLIYIKTKKKGPVTAVLLSFDKANEE